MGKYRIYPSKSNTIIENTPTINTGLNEVMELWYGKYGITRHLIKFEFSGYNQQYQLGYVPHITAGTSTFKLFPVYPIDLDYDERFIDNFDIEVHTVQQDWSEGSGYDFINGVAGYSNWLSATTVESWASSGGDYLYQVFSGNISPSNEYISADVTDEVELWNTFTGNNFGFIVKYSDEYEALSGGTLKYMSRFFTEKTHTYFKPFIEVSWTDTYSATSGVTMSGSPNYFLSLPNLLSEYYNDIITYIDVNAYEMYTSNISIIENLEYKIVLKDGLSDFIMVDWESVEYSDDNGNRILLNTNWFIPDNIYEIKFRYVVDNSFYYPFNNTYEFKVIED